MSRFLLAGTVLAATASLSACYVVPIDARTGQPYGAPSPDPLPIVVAPPAPPQPAVLSARLYPLNTQANRGGLLTAVVVDDHTGRGRFSVSYLGDTLQGESTRVEAGDASFGRIHAEVLGASPREFSGRRGIANAFGTKGVNAQCEYLITGPNLGTGACQFSDGARYRLHFGN